MELVTDREQAVRGPLQGRIFLEGPAGAGKTTAAVERLGRLLAGGVPGRSILVLVPQRILGDPFADLLRSSETRPGSRATILTLSGLARRMVELYWPLVGEGAGFSRKNQPPTFLSLELAQYYMSKVTLPLLESGYFEGITIDRNRLYSEILDNLNKSAVVGFTYNNVASRLAAAWIGESNLIRGFDQAQECAVRFRELCLEHNLLDFSLQVEVFTKFVWPLEVCRQYLTQRYLHLIVDNLEEDTPVAQDLILEWLPYTESALVVYDWDGGFRRFLGADPHGAEQLRAACDQSLSWDRSLVTTPALRALERSFAEPGRQPDGAAAVSFESHRYFPEMIEWVADTTSWLIEEEGVTPNDIAVLAPYLSDSLRFSLNSRLNTRGIGSYSHRPSRPLREQPATHSLLTLARLAHPTWNQPPSKEEFGKALLVAVDGLDLVRAKLIAEILYRPDGTLNSFEGLASEAQERITYALGTRYERLRTWIAEAIASAPMDLDVFLGRLFGELLSQPGFGFHGSHELGAITANLVDSIFQFRTVVEDDLVAKGSSVAVEYLHLVGEGLIAAHYLRSWQSQPEHAVLLAPAYTFLLSNRPVDYQVWLNVGSSGWWERPYQPLTHPYVLSRGWQHGRRWTDQDEMRTREQTLRVLAQGLIRRCRKRIYMGLSELNERGTEQQGPLLETLQRAVLNQGG